MRGAGDLPLAIQWSEGMLLAPQHFQQLALRSERLLAYQLETAAPYGWGVRHLEIDPVLLVEGTFRVRTLEAIMPDGLVVSHGTQGEELELDLATLGDDLKRGAVTIHLVVAAQSSGASSVRGELARYRSVEAAPVVDDNTGQDEVAIPRLEPRLKLLAGDEPASKYSSFPLARVGYRNEALSEVGFWPPMLRVGPYSEVSRLCSRIAKALREKAIFLSEQARSPRAAASGPQALEMRMLISSLVSGLPLFEEVMESGNAHPYTVYLALCSLVGQVAAVSEALVPPDFAPYEHNDLAASFGQMEAYVERVLRERILESHSMVAFTRVDGGFELLFDESWSGRGLVLGVRGGPDMSDHTVLDWIGEAIIASGRRIREMRERRVLGASRNRIDRDGDLMPARGVTLFSLASDPTAIDSGEILRIDDPPSRRGSERPVEIVLYIRNDEREAEEEAP